MSPEPAILETFKTSPTFFLLALLVTAVGVVLALIGAVVLGKSPRVTMALGAAAALAALLSAGAGLGGASMARARTAALMSLPGLSSSDQARLTLFAEAEARIVRNFGVAIGLVPLLAGIALIAVGSSRSRKRASQQLVDTYEREHITIPAPAPIESIRFRMERKGLSGIDRVPIFKTTARLSEVMTKPRRLNLAMIRRLPERLAMTKP